MRELPSRLAAALADRYRLERELGEGGMATVYLAQDLKHDRRVAIKVLRPELAAMIGGGRFLAEIRTTASLQHPHILPLFDSGEADGFLFYVMPYVEGESLRERLDRDKQLPVPEAVRIARAVAGALDHAHRQGVIHRDIKPANILMQDGQPVVADFGIALAVSAAGGGRLTETGLSLGTPYYMSPEQATADRDPGPTSDVYSLGCVLYEMIAGDPPYTGSTAQAVLARILTDRPRPLTELRETVPPNVAMAVTRALAKIPADRFESAAAFAAALEDPTWTFIAHTDPRLTAALPPSQGPGGGRAGSWAPWIVAALAVVAAVSAWAVRPQGDVVPPTAFRAELSGFEVESALGGGWRLAISPDGRTVVAGGPDDHLYVRRSDDPEFRRVSGTAGARNPAFSPDGSWIVFSLEGALVKVPVIGGGVLPVAVRGGSPHWFTEDSIAFNLGDVPSVVGAAGGTARPLAPDASGGRVFVLPGGRRFLAQLPDGGIAVVDRESGESTTLLESGWQPRYVPTGHIIYGDRSTETLFAVGFDARRGELTGTPVRVLPSVLLFGGGALQAAVSDNGTLVYLPGRGETNMGQKLAWVDLDGNVTDLPVAVADVNMIRISPDGRRLLYGDEVDEEVDDAEVLFVYDLVTGERTRAVHLLASTPNVVGVWHPDGSRLLAQPLSGALDPAWISADGSDTLALVEDWEAGGPITSFSHDGRWLLAEDWSRISPRAPDILVGRLADEPLVTRPILRAEWAERNGEISPDGRWIAYTSEESGTSHVYVRPFPEIGLATLISPGLESAGDPVWSPDGSSIYFLAEDGSGRRMMRARVASSPPFRTDDPEPLFAADRFLPVGFLRTWDLHPAGDRFVTLLAPQAGRAGSQLGPAIVIVNWFEELTRLTGS